MARQYDEIRFTGTPEEVNAQWLAARAHGIGGSDAAAILGLSAYKTPYTVWLEKTGRMVPEDISEKEAVYWGNVLEDVVAKEYAKRHPGLTVRRKNALLQSKERPWQLASLDRVVTDESGRHGVLEIKTAGAFREGDWEEGIPDYYLPQCIHYLAVTGYEFFAVAVLIGGQKYREFLYERDEEDVAFIIEREQAFYDAHIAEDQPPTVTGADADASALFGQHPQGGGDFVRLLDMDFKDARKLARLNAKIKALTEEKKALTNAMKERIGDAKGILTQNYRITWQRGEVKAFDTKAFERDHPELAAAYTVTKPRDGGIRIVEVK